MGFMDKVLRALDLDAGPADPAATSRGDWQSGYNDGYTDGRTNREYREPATNTDQARGGYAFGYSDGDLSRQDREAGWLW
jgi:hypothetical protein